MDNTTFGQIDVGKEQTSENYQNSAYNPPNYTHFGTCPNCGYCPHCGRGRRYFGPYGWYPTSDYYYQPTNTVFL